MLNKIFDPNSILDSNMEKAATLKVRPSITNMEELDKVRQIKEDLRGIDEEDMDNDSMK
jgi:hypothetical protein